MLQQMSRDEWEAAWKEVYTIYGAIRSRLNILWSDSLKPEQGKVLTM